MKHNFNSISQVEKDRILEMHIRRVLEEQGTSLNLGGNFQQGQNKTLKSGQAAGEDVKAFIKQGLNTAKETVFNIGKLVLRIIFTGVGIICAIGYAVFKVAEAIVNALTKFLTATGKVVVRAAQKVSEATINILATIYKKLGIAVKAGMDFIGSLFKSLKDGAYNIIVSCLKALKQFGVMVWGKILVMASTVKEFGQNVWNWCKQQFTAISKQIGMAWDSAVNLAKQGWNAVKNLGSQAVDFGKKAANKVADAAGQAYGAVKGFAQGLFEDAILFYETYISIRNSNTLALINECSKITKNIII